MNENDIPTPTQHKRALGSKRQLWNSECTNHFWRATTIDKILRDERYTGKLVALKTTLSELGNIRSAKPIERNGWIVISGAFEAIISQELFDLAQTRKLRPFRKIGPMKRYLFSRKLKFGYCGAALQRHEISQGVYYACDGRAWNGTDDCKKIRLFEAQKAEIYLSFDLGEISQTQYREQCMTQKEEYLQQRL